MSYDTLTTTGRNRAEYTLDTVINLAKFPQKEVYPKATVVKIDTATGKLDAALVAGDIPFGVIVAPCKKADETPTVITQFSAVIVAKATETVVAGDKIYINGYDSTDKISRVTKVGTAAGSVQGLVLSGGAANGEVRVGLFLSPIWKAADIQP